MIVLILLAATGAAPPRPPHRPRSSSRRRRALARSRQAIHSKRGCWSGRPAYRYGTAPTLRPTGRTTGAGRSPSFPRSSTAQVGVDFCFQESHPAAAYNDTATLGTSLAAIEASGARRSVPSVHADVQATQRDPRRQPTFYVLPSIIIRRFTKG
jgi:hypothetical protein